MNDKEEPTIIREKYYRIKKNKEVECSQCTNNLEELEEQK